MTDQPPPKRQCRPPRRFPWCDQRFRCAHCPNGMGPGGRGFTRARNVPCSSPDVHLTVNDKDNCDRYWLSDPNCVHFDLLVGRELNRATGDAAKPGRDRRCKPENCPRLSPVGQARFERAMPAVLLWEFATHTQATFLRSQARGSVRSAEKPSASLCPC